MKTSTRKLDHTEWAHYFDELSKHLGLKTISILVEGLDLGVQPAASRMQLLGITYDHEDDAVEIAANGLEHRIAGPKHVYVQEDASGHLLSCSITDAQGHEQILELDPPMVVAAS